MRRSRFCTVAGGLQLVAAAFLALTFLFGRPPVTPSLALGITPTSIPAPTDVPTPGPPTAVPPDGTQVPPTPPAAPEPGPEITISKSASPSEVHPGGLVTYGIQACNVGGGAAASVIVSDAVPGEMDLVSASASQGRVFVEGNGVRAELGALEIGACATVTIVARVRPDVAPGTEIRNVGSVGDIYDDVIVKVLGLLPETGVGVPLAFAAALALLGVVSLLVGAVQEARNRS